MNPPSYDPVVIDELFRRLHDIDPSLPRKSAITAGMARSIETAYQHRSLFIEEDPIYSHAYTLAAPFTLVAKQRLQNIF